MADDRANILIVDDRDDNLRALEAILAELDQRVVRARSGPEALRFLLKNEAAVVLLDVQMPELDGFETAQLIRQRDATKNIPIIFVTGLNTADEHVRRGYDLGAVDYIIKPIVPMMLLARVSLVVELYHYRAAQIRGLETELEAERRMVRRLTGASATALPADFVGASRVEREWEQDYLELLQAYVRAATESGSPPHDAARALGERIARSGGGARQVVMLHTRGAKTIQDHSLPSQIRFLLDRGRILSLELMGHLADSYRRRVAECERWDDPSNRPALRPTVGGEDRVPSKKGSEGEPLRSPPRR